MVRKVRETTPIATDGPTTEPPVDIQSLGTAPEAETSKAKSAVVAKAPKASFDILSCEADSRGFVVVSFSAMSSETPLFAFQSNLGNIYPSQPAKLESAGMAGVDLLRVTGDVPSEWFLSDESGEVNYGKNVSPRWALADEDTFFISCGKTPELDAAEPSATFCDPVTGGLTPLEPGQNLHFSILTAIHRCTARIELACLSATGEVLLKETRKVDPAYLGGMDDADYYRVDIDFTVPAAAGFLQITIVKGATITPDEDAFVFFARPSLAVKPITDAVRTVPLALLAQLKQHPELQVYSAELPVPSELCLDQKKPVSLIVSMGAQAQRVDNLDVSWDSPVQIDACWLENRDVLIRGVRPFDGFDDLQVGIFVDGELSVEGTISDSGAFQTRFSLAAANLDGKPHAIEVRLLPGEFTIARTFGTVAFYLTPWEALQEYAKGPFSLTASPAAVHHYRSYRLWVENAKTRTLPNLGVLNQELLQGFKKRTVYPPLSFPEVKKPTVSIVIPVHNKFEVTYFCLCSLLFAYNDASFEVIVVDDGSIDATLKIKDVVSGISVVRHEKAMGFVDSCNDGAAIARGDYIFFLNNDTEVTSRCLDELVSVFENFDNVGLAGSKLLYPNGKLQEAGGIVWRNGNPWNVGRNGNPLEPQYSYLRQADYISGAAILVPRKIWTEVGGFSQEMAPAYFEDADLAMKIRDTGRFVVYVPNSVVFHFEGQSAGTSTASGMKRFQEINRPKFKRKWPKIYSRHGVEGVRPDLEKDRNIKTRILALDHAFPFVDSDAGSFAAFQEIRLLQSLGAKVTFMPRNLAWMDRHTIALEKIGVECLYAPFVMDIEAYLRDHGTEYDVFYITRFRIAEEFVELIRRYAPDAKIIMNLADLHFLREMREAAIGSENYNYERAMETRQAELRTIASVDLTLSYSDVEATVIQSHLMGEARVAKVPWVVDVNEKPRPKFADTKDIVFLGGFAHYPNGDAVKFFVQYVMPLLREKLPDVRFRVVGSRAPADILALESESVEIVGFVQDLNSIFQTTRVYVAPLLAGAGLKGKVIEGMAQGMPSVLSPVAAEGTGLVSGFDCFVAKSAEEWVDAIVKLYTDEALWTSVGNAAKEGARQRFSFAAGQETMRDALAMVDIFADTEASGLYYKWSRP